MIPLPPHRAAAERIEVAHRTNADGSRSEGIVEIRTALKGRWLIHPNGFLSEYDATSLREYGITNYSERTYRELGFLGQQSETSWAFVPVQDSDSWLAHRILSWTPADVTEGVIVFDGSGKWHKENLHYRDGFDIRDGGQKIRLQGKEGVRLYRVTDNRIIPFEQR